MASDERPSRGLISAEEVQDLLHWSPPSVNGSAVNASEIDQIRELRLRARRAAEAAELMAASGPAPLITAEELAGIRKAAYEEGYAEGLRLGRLEGLKRGETESLRHAQQWQALVSALTEPLKGQEAAVEQQLLELATALAAQLVRREIHQNPGQIVAVIREAMSYLPVSRQVVRLFLHPDDAALVRETLSLSAGNEHSWQIVEDPGLSRGGCRVATETSNLDASLETRLAALFAEILGGARDDDA